MRGRSVVKQLALALAIAAPTAGSAGWIGGVFVVKGVRCDVTATGIGSIKQTPQAISCEIAPPAAGQGIVGMALCENQGGNQPPGLFPASIGAFFATAPINQGNVLKNGKAFVPVTTMPSSDQLLALVYACPNPNFTVVDFVPCAFVATVKLLDATTGAVLNSASYDCTLPADQCMGLQIDKTTGLPVSVPYTCTLTP